MPVRCSGNMTVSFPMLRNGIRMLLAVACGLPGFALTQPQAPNRKDFDWLLGTWKREPALSVTLES